MHIAFTNGYLTIKGKSLNYQKSIRYGDQDMRHKSTATVMAVKLVLVISMGMMGQFLGRSWSDANDDNSFCYGCNICMCLYLSVYLSVCLPIHLSVYPSIYLFVCLSIHLSIHPSIYTYIYIHMHIHIYIVYIYIHIYIYTYICSIYLRWQISGEATTYSDAFLDFGRESYQKSQETPGKLIMMTNSFNRYIFNLFFSFFGVLFSDP